MYVIEFIHEAVLIPYNVYTVVASGLTEMTGVKSEPGNHVYELAPLAVNVCVVPAQILDCGEAVIERFPPLIPTFKVELPTKPQLGDEIETVIVPPAIPTCVLIEFVKDDPVQPPGRVQE